MVSQILDYHLDSSKIPCQVKHEVQVSTADVWEANSSIGIKSPSIVDVQLNQVKLFHSITPSKMAELQKRCSQLSVVYEYVANNVKPKLSVIHRIRSKPIRMFTTSVWPIILNMGCPASPNIYERRWNPTVSFTPLTIAIPCFNHSMMIMVIREFNAWLNCYNLRYTGLRCSQTLTVGLPNVNSVILQRVIIQSLRLNKALKQLVSHLSCSVLTSPKLILRKVEKRIF